MGGDGYQETINQQTENTNFHDNSMIQMVHDGPNNQEYPAKNNEYSGFEEWSGHNVQHIDLREHMD